MNAPWSDEVSAAPPPAPAGPEYEPQRPAHSTSWRRAARGAAAIGTVLSLILVPGVFAGRTLLIERVTVTGDAISGRLATGSAMIATAGTRVTAVIEGAGAVADAADALTRRIESPTAVTDVTDAYLQFSTSYDDASTAVVAALPEFEALDGPPDGELAARLRDGVDRVREAVSDLDERMADLMATPQVQLAVRVVGFIGDAARQVKSTAEGLSVALEDAGAQLDATRERVISTASDITTSATIVAMAAVTWLLYTSVLNVVLLRFLR